MTEEAETIEAPLSESPAAEPVAVDVTDLIVPAPENAVPSAEEA